MPDDHWDYTSSLCIIRELMDNRMFPLTLKGLEEGMAELSQNEYNSIHLKIMELNGGHLL